MGNFESGNYEDIPHIPMQFDVEVIQTSTRIKDGK